MATALLLLAIYWLTVSGVFHSVDEHSVFAVSRNLVVSRATHQSDLYWGEGYGDPAQLGRAGELYSKYGLGHSILVAGLVVLARFVPGAGAVSTAMLLAAGATAFTGGLLVLIAGHLDYSERVGGAIALLYGLATFAWVYARTLFGEPLVALGWVIAIWLLARDVDWKRAFLAGMAVALTITVRPALIALAPAFAIGLWQGRPRAFLSHAGIFLLPIVVATIDLLAFNHWRFGHPLQFGYSEHFEGSLNAGLLGFLFSLDRSIFIFAPPLLLLPWAAPAFLRRHGRLGWTILALAIGSLLLYSLWPVFWGGPVWGPRYLLPTVPLLMLLLAPLVARAWQSNSWQRWALALLALVGVVIQLPAVIWNPLPATQTLGQRFPVWLLRPRAAWLDLAWLRTEHWTAAALCTLLLLLALITLRRPRPRLLLLAVVVSFIVSTLLLSWLGTSNFTINYRPAYASVLARLERDARPGDALVVNPAPYQSTHGQVAWFWDRPHLRLPLYGLIREVPGELGQSPERIHRLFEKQARLWLLTEGVAPGAPDSTTERQLAQMGAIADTTWLEDGFRLTLFAAPQPPTLSGTPGQPLGNVASLEAWDITWPAAAPNTVQVHLRWQPLAASPTPRDETSLHTFLQLLDQRGNLVADWAGVPQTGFAPTTSWQPDIPVDERITLALPPQTPPGKLQLIAGLYDPATGQRLLAPDGADSVTLTSITISSQ